MACFLTPTTTAIITSNLKKKIPTKYHLEWLNVMLWGGSVMLAVEHIAHGEVVLYPPFLTAMQNPADIPVMLKELVIVGGAMTVAIILTWVTMVMVANKIEKIKKNQETVTALN